MKDIGSVTGLVHSTESFGSVDGPGVRFVIFMRSEERRVGKECRSRWSPYH